MAWLPRIGKAGGAASEGGRRTACGLPPGLRRPVLLSVANPLRAAPLAGVAVRIAAARQTGVLLLHVARKRDPAPAPQDPQPEDWPALSAALEVARQAGAPAGWVVREADNVGQTIRQTAAEARASLIILGWRGTNPEQNASLAVVLEDPLCDVAVVSGASTGPLERLLTPVAGGPHAALAARLAAELAGGAEAASITALHVAPAGSSPSRVFAAAQRQFRHSLGRGLRAANVTRKTVAGDDTAQAILNELASGYDAVLVGTSREALIDRLAFGDIPQRVAEASPTMVIAVRRRMSWAARTVRNSWQALTDALPVLTAEERQEVRDEIGRGSTARADFFVMIGLSAVLAALGLLLNSPAVIIGAMLVAPLMSAIVGLGLGVVAGDARLLAAAGRATLGGTALAVGLGVLMGLATPGASATPEILSRTQPNVLDLGVALASGAAGAYALCRKGVSAALAGVAIAAALVPPLATAGLGLALARTAIAGGAFLLFLTNLIAIASAGGLVFLLLGFAPAAREKAQRSILRRGMAGVIVLLLAVTLILGLLTGQALQALRAERAVQAAVSSGVARLLPDSELVDLKRSSGADGGLQLVVTVRSPRQYAHDTVLAFQRDVATSIQRPVALVLDVIPASRLDPLAPPTFTPAATAAPAAVPGPTATSAATASPTATPSPTATATATATATSTATPTGTATGTPTLTATVTATATPTATATATPRPTPGFAVVTSTSRQGVFLRAAPGGKVIAAIGDGTPVILLGERVEAGGRVWARVQAPGKPDGWIALDYLSPLAAQP